MENNNNIAEIIGLLCAEGSHITSYCSYWEKEGEKLRYRKNKKSERIEFYNKDIKLLNHYKELIFKEFGINSNITKHGKINIGNIAIIRKITLQTPLGHLNWRVPQSIINGNQEIKISFLRGFFDGDGTASGSIRFFSTNEKGIRQVSSLLTDLSFRHTIQGPITKPNRKKYYIIQVSRKDKLRFFEEIKPISKLPKLK